MKEYDLAFGLGFSCGVSQALRAAGLQFASFPLDWTGSPDIDSGLRLVAGDFAGWFEADDFELADVRHGAGFCTRCYLNRKTRLVHTHEFSDFEPFSATYPKVRATYDRRVERFLKTVQKSRRILAVYIELPTRSRISDDALISARKTLSEKFSHADVDLLYIFAEPGRARPCIEQFAPGIDVASYDYRKFDDGEITHFIEWEPLVPLLREAYRAADLRSDEEKIGFRKFEKMASDLRWGPDKSRFRRWLNKHAYKTFRSLESVLLRRGLIHKEGPLWVWPEARATNPEAK